MRFTLADFSNHEIGYFMNHEIKLIHKDCSTYVFIPFSLYREHKIWKSIYNNVGDISSHINWLDYRIKLFSDYCLPGLNQQVYRDFEVIFLIDGYEGFTFLRNWIINRLSSVMINKVDSKNANPKFSFLECNLYPNGDPSSSYPKVLSQRIRDFLKTKKKNQKTLLLYRLDSDDTLMKFNIYDSMLILFMLKTKKVFRSPTLIDFPVGLQANYNENSFYRTLWPESTFPGLLIDRESLKDPNTIITFGYSHDKIPNTINRICVVSHLPYWIQGVHSDNVSNSIFPWSEKINESQFIS